MSGYDTHTGNELKLLLAGSKPLAAFCFYQGADEEACLSGQDFEQSVADGKLLKFENVSKIDDQQIKHVLFTTPSESWRAHAYLHLMAFMFQRDWCAHLEWIQGSLLGYTDAENRAHFQRKYGSDGPTLSCKK